MSEESTILDDTYLDVDAYIANPDGVLIQPPDDTAPVESSGLAGPALEWVIMAYNKFHDEQGKFAFGPGAGWTSARTPIQKITAKEKSIKDLGYEEGFAVGKDGTVLVNKSGGRDYVEFTPAEMESMRQDGNVILTHNHPRSYTLSTSDIRVAKDANLAEIRAVNPTGTYIATRPPSGWPSYVELDMALRSSDALAQAKVLPMVHSGRFDNDPDAEAANKIHSAEMIMEASKILKFGYRYEAHKTT